MPYRDCPLGTAITVTGEAWDIWLRTTGFQDSVEQLFHPMVPIHLPTAMLLKNPRRWKTGGERNSHANEDLIKRENKGESALIRVPGGGKVLTGTGLIKTSSLGSFGKCF